MSDRCDLENISEEYAAWNMRDKAGRRPEEHRSELTDAWGVTFRGRADAATGHVWWWTRDDGRRIPLRPANPKTNLDMKECRKR